MAPNDEDMVGFENEAEKIFLCLIRGTSELDVVPIVGMGGQGKTTIARQMYGSVFGFDVRAWCIISQTYNRRELLQEIVSRVTGSKDKGDSDDILADELRKSLMGKRYLIVLDDMSDGMARDELRLSFPNDNNGSRIIVTTRFENVGNQVKYHSDPYSLPFLTPDESCRLLQKKVFQREGCPPELQELSLEIAKKCKGLPLVIILVAGIIKRKKMEASWWDEVKNSLLSYVGEADDYSRFTMQLSYDNLPHYLKPCLLYMGMFPQDAKILVSKLISLWIAEGFVQNIESGRLEETAEDYLMDLISSNVVMVSRRRYNGNVKYCQVHDVVLHFCLEKSREEKFMLAVKGDFQPLDWKVSRVTFNYSNDISKSASPGSKTRKPFHQHLRSLISVGGYVYWNPFDQCSEVRLLKVLDVSSHIVDHFSSATLKPLIHLKFLAVSTNKFDFHPEPHLPHLETLLVCCWNRSTLLPASFWKMEKLRHVDITDSLHFDLEEDKQGIFEESSKLENLRILKRVVIYEADTVDVLVRRCPNLQELDIGFEVDKDSAEICLKLDSLTQLHSFRLTDSYGSVSKLHLPTNLKKLVLIGSPLEIAISFIPGLPSLEYVKLWEWTSGVRSREWCLGDTTFHNLKVLKLLSLGMSRWDATEESFPQLETLVIKGCYKLEEIPLSFADIPTLKLINLIECNESLVDSAVKIKEDIEATEGCDRLYLFISDTNKFLAN